MGQLLTRGTGGRLKHSFVVRPVSPGDSDEWVRLRTLLWPDWPDDHVEEVGEFLKRPPPRGACFVAESEGGLIGFAEGRLREYAEDCDSSPVGYLEGIYVERDCRITGVGRALVEAVEVWARSSGCIEMASDRDISNEVSGEFHLSVGFSEVIRLVTYRKDL